MPYVREHGKQLAIVHGERSKITGKVEQRILFTFYSKREAEAAITAESRDCSYFRYLLEAANPQLKFNWQKLDEEIRGKLEMLPDIYPLSKARSEDALEQAVDQMVRELITNDPASEASRKTLKRYSADLAVLKEIIDLRLAQASIPRKDNSESPFHFEDRFLWRHELKNQDGPGDLADYAEEAYQSGDYQRALQFFTLLVRCYPNYAEGHNTLGLIELKCFNPKAAVEHFRNCVRTGRTLFPSRIPKGDYWYDLKTRPYMRGLMNLALALNQAGQWKECLVICDQLDKECGPRGEDTAAAHRAVAHLNLHNWQACIDASLTISDSSPDEGFVLGFALFELDRADEALEWFVHAALNYPHTAHILLDKKKAKPTTYSEVEDHNGGVEIRLSLKRFLDTQSKQSSKFFSKLIAHDELKNLMAEVIQCDKNHSSRDKSSRENLMRWNELKERKFAKKLAKQLRVLQASK